MPQTCMPQTLEPWSPGHSIKMAYLQPHMMGALPPPPPTHTLLGGLPMPMYMSYRPVRASSGRDLNACTFYLGKQHVHVYVHECMAGDMIRCTS